MKTQRGFLTLKIFYAHAVITLLFYSQSLLCKYCPICTLPSMSTTPWTDQEERLFFAMKASLFKLTKNILMFQNECAYLPNIRHTVYNPYYLNISINHKQTKDRWYTIFLLFNSFEVSRVKGISLEK